MTSHTPLPPHLERFVREQLASGRFQSEGEVIRAAVQLLEEHSPPRGAPGTWLRQGTDSGPRDKPAGGARRSPRGVLADLRSGIGPDEIREARGELWSGFPRGEPG